MLVNWPFFCKSLFQKSHPQYPEEHWHYRVVSASNLLESFKREGSRLKFNRPESDALSKLLDERGDASISFSMFLLLVRHAIESRESPRTIGTSTRDRLKKINNEEAMQDWYLEMFGNPLKGIRGSLLPKKGNGNISYDSDDGDDGGTAEGMLSSVNK